MPPLPCQQDMLHTRRDFPHATRIYVCSQEKIAASVTGPGEDAGTLAAVCRELCAAGERTPSQEEHPVTGHPAGRGI